MAQGGKKRLKNENIDILNYTDNLKLMTQRALSPAKIESLDIDEENKSIAVYLKPDQVSLAIGKRGMNIKLAGRMVGFDIEVFRDTDDDEVDIDIEEFADEIDGWVIDELKKIGCDTAKSVLELSESEVIRRTDLEDETVKEIFEILKSEFAADE